MTSRKTANLHINRYPRANARVNYQLHATGSFARSCSRMVGQRAQGVTKAATGRLLPQRPGRHTQVGGAGLALGWAPPTDILKFSMMERTLLHDA